MPLSPLTGTLGEHRARHLIRRLTFGSGHQQVKKLFRLSAPAALSRLLATTNLPEPPRLPQDSDGQLPSDYDWNSQPGIEGEKDHRLRASLLAWWVGGMATDTTALGEIYFLSTYRTNY